MSPGQEPRTGAPDRVPELGTDLEPRAGAQSLAPRGAPTAAHRIGHRALAPRVWHRAGPKARAPSWTPSWSPERGTELGAECWRRSWHRAGRRAGERTGNQRAERRAPFCARSHDRPEHRGATPLLGYGGTACNHVANATVRAAVIKIMVGGATLFEQRSHQRAQRHGVRDELIQDGVRTWVGQG